MNGSRTLMINSAWERRGCAPGIRVAVFLLVLGLSPLPVPADQWYVSESAGDDASAGTNWLTARKTIQAAVDLAGSGDTVWVTNGLYNLNGAIMPGHSTSNRVMVTNAVVVQSVNGPAGTVIEGMGPIGSDAMRCAYLANGAVLSGFTITNGHTFSGGLTNSAGGGVFAANGTVTNCVLTGNAASEYGGGVYGGILQYSTVSGNTALYGGAVASGTVFQCTLDWNTARNSGGAACGAVMTNTLVLNNVSSNRGGGLIGGSLVGGAVSNNSALYDGGGAYGSTLQDCPVVSNSAPDGGGAYLGILSNCTVIGNTADLGGGMYGSTGYESTFTGNYATNWGGGAIGGALIGCRLVANYSPIGGGAQGTTMAGCVVSNNLAAQGGGLYGGCITNTLIAGNLATNCGGGVMYASLWRCTIADNSAATDAGGAYGGSLVACALYGNRAGVNGGGSRASAMTNCTVVANSARQGGGTDVANLYNCIVYFNNAARDPNCYRGTAVYTCSTPLPDGAGNMDDDPRLLSGGRLGPDSPCRFTGSAAYATATDIDGEAWGAPPAMGCDQLNTGNLTGPLTVVIRPGYSRFATDFPVTFRADIQGRARNTLWDFNDGHFGTNLFLATHAWSSPNVYAVTLTACNDDYPAGVTATALVTVVSRPVYYADRSNPAPASPYMSWATAATNLQDAASLAVTNVPGSLLLVTNGVYDTVYRLTPSGSLKNRIVVTNAVTIRSVNGPEETHIVGRGPLGANAIRCAYLANGAVLDGFTLTNGFTLSSSGDMYKDQSGGGTYAFDGTLTNCRILLCSAYWYGAGAYGGTLLGCTLTGNNGFYGGGAGEARLEDCVLDHNKANSGGGAYSCGLLNSFVASNSASKGGALYCGSADICEVISNTASSSGGAAWGATFRDSRLVQNSGYYGGAICDSVLSRCTLATNTAYQGGGAYGTTLPASRLLECRLYGNSATEGGGGWGATLDRCLLLGNSSSLDGGGAYQSALTNCLIANSSAANYGGGVYGSTLAYCTLSGNSADVGGGAFQGTANDTILYFNTCGTDGANYYETTLQHSCADPLDPGTGNIDVDPQFVDAAGGNYRLRYGSPCLDVAAAVAGISSDLDGNPRPLDWNADGTNAPDMGCYEYNPLTADSNADSIPDWWCLKYLFDPNSDAVATGNADDDPHSNLQEWLADTNPTNGASRLCITALDLTSTPRVFFSSSASRMYSLEWTTDLVNQPWTNVPGLIPRAGGSDPDWFDDASHSGVTNIFYRIRASLP